MRLAGECPLTAALDCKGLKRGAAVEDPGPLRAVPRLDAPESMGGVAYTICAEPGLKNWSAVIL